MADTEEKKKGAARAEEFEAKVDAFIALNNEKIRKARKMQREEIEKAARAQETMNRAVTDGDVEAYSQAKAVMQRSQDAAEMYGMTVTRLEDDPLINANEYDSFIGEVTNAYYEDDLEAAEEIYQLMNQVMKIKDRMKVEFETMNRTIEKLHHHIYHSKVSYIRRIDLRDTWSVPWAAKNTGFYENYKRKHKKESGQK